MKSNKKQIVNLAERKDFTIPGCERILTETEDGYTLVFIENRLPDLSNMDYTQARCWLKYHPDDEYGRIIQYRGPKNISFALYSKKWVTNGRQTYTKKTWRWVIRLEENRVITSKDNLIWNDANTFLDFFGLECIHKELSDSMLSVLLRNKAVLKKIFTQKITNTHQAVETYFQSSWKIKGVDYELLKKWTARHIYPDINLASLRDFTTSVGGSIRFLLCENHSGEDKNMFVDLIRDAQVLDIRINPRWSRKRMLQEHTLNTEKIMLASECALSDDLIHEGIDPVIEEETLGGHILNSERETFSEGSFMHHCVFTHYFGKMKSKHYISISIDYPERCTVGIDRNGDTGVPEIHQVYGKYNHSIKENTRTIIDSFFQRHIAFFDSLLQPSQGSRSRQADALVPAGAPEDYFDDNLPY